MKPKKPAAKAAKAAKRESKEITPFVSSNGKSLGARALANAAERFAAATTHEAWHAASLIEPGWTIPSKKKECLR